jgi:hypothetical protein
MSTEYTATHMIYALNRLKRLGGKPWMLEKELAFVMIKSGLAEQVTEHKHHIECSVTQFGKELIERLKI